MILAGKALDKPRFTIDQCDALFAAVLIDDEIDAHTDLPETIQLDFSDRQLIDCFRICRQLWQTGVHHSELIELAQKLARDHDLAPADRLRFKYARAKFKHLRFAYALYGADHRYPVLLDWMTTAMGHLQDAFKNGHQRSVSRHTALFRCFLMPLPRRLLEHRMNRFVPTNGAGFRRYVEQQIATLRALLSEDAITGHQFHATRKIISRLVSFYDSLRTIEPSAEAYMMSRSLSAINGLMGQMHDELVEHRISGAQDYYRGRFDLPDEIRRRLTALVQRYPR